MDLTQPTPDNLAYMIEEIKKKLRMMGGGAIRPEHFDLEQYEDIKDLYDHIRNKAQFSINEIESLVTELGRMRKGD